MVVINDEKLIEQYLKGDEKSLEILIKKYIKPIYGFVYHYLGSASDAEDITQEVFVRAWRNLKKFDPRKSRCLTLQSRQEKSFKAWIFKIAKNASIDFLKKKKTIPFSKFNDEKGGNLIIETFVDHSLPSDKIFERKNLGYTLIGAIEGLPSKYREVLFSRYHNDLSFREIAELFREPLNTVKSRYHRAVKMLKKILINF